MYDTFNLSFSQVFCCFIKRNGRAKTLILISINGIICFLNKRATYIEEDTYYMPKRLLIFFIALLLIASIARSATTYTYELVETFDDWSVPISANDVLEGMWDNATIIAGGFHPSLPDGPQLTDGQLGSPTDSVLLDFAPGKLSLHIRYDLDEPVVLMEIRTFGGNPDRDGRVFQDVDFEYKDANGVWQEFLHEATTGPYYVSNNDQWEASLIRVYDDTAGPLLGGELIYGLGFKFWLVDNTQDWFLPRDDSGVNTASIIKEIDAVCEATVRVKGIDVSSWQGYVDWEQVRQAGYRFAFARATLGDETTGSLTDEYFEINMEEGEAAGMLMGAYHFAYAGEGTEAASEARHFLNVAGPYLKSGYLRPVLDLETGASLGKAALSNWVHEWMDTVKNKTGIEPIIYTNSYYANYYLDNSISQYDLWIANWTCNVGITPDTGIWDDWAFWQYWGPSECGYYYVPGVSGNVDLDLFNGNLSQLEEFEISVGDLNGDDSVDFSDYSILAGRWMDDNCEVSNNCDGADINFSGSVDIVDLQIFSQHWLEFQY